MRAMFEINQEFQIFLTQNASSKLINSMEDLQRNQIYNLWIMQDDEFGKKSRIKLPSNIGGGIDIITKQSQ
jgi:hypothetical protein